PVPTRPIILSLSLLEAREPLILTSGVRPGACALWFLTGVCAKGVVTMRLFSQRPGGHRDDAPLIAELKRRGWWRERRLGRLRVILLEAHDVYAAASDLARRGVLCYDFR